MAFELSARAEELNERLKVFMDEYIYPREHDFEEFTSDQNNLWQYPDWYQGLKDEAKKQGLWNLFLPEEYKPCRNFSYVRISSSFIYCHMKCFVCS